MRRWISLEDKEIDKLKEFISTVEAPVEIQEKVDWDSIHHIVKKFERQQKQIKTSSAKSKGRNLQKWVCEKISNLLNIPYEQSDDQCLIHSREMGQSGVDVVLRGDALEKFPYSIECKNTETFNLFSTVNQASDNKREGTDWLIVHKRKNLSEPVVLMGWNAFETLFKKTL